MLLATLPWIGNLGMEYDECHFVETATRIVAKDPKTTLFPEGLYLDGRPFPFMTMPYVGALDGWLMAIPVGLFGFHPVVPRMANLVAGLVVLLAAYLLGRRVGGPAAGAIAIALLLVDLEWLLHVPVHYGPFLLQCLCGALVWLFLDYWLSEGRSRYFYGACFFAGLGFQEKLTFAWIVALIAVTFLAFRGRDVLRRLTVGRVVIGLAIFLIAMLPVLIYTVGQRDEVLGYGTSSMQIPSWETLFSRLGTFRHTLAGQEFMAQQLGFAGVPRFSALEILFWVALALSLILRNRPALMLCGAVFGLVLLQTFFTDGGRLHHYLLAYPLLQCGIACVAVQRRWLLIPAILLITATGISTARNLIWYSNEIARTGGQGHWSNAINDVAAWMRGQKDRVFLSTTWGFYRPLYFLTGGRVAIHDRYFALRNEQMNSYDLEDVTVQVRRRGTYWLTSSIDPEFKNNERHLFDLALHQGFTPQLVKEFRARDGRPIYQVYSFHDDKEGDSSWRSIEGRASGETGAEFALPPEFREVRFRMTARWQLAKTMTVEWQDASGKRLRAWWRFAEKFQFPWPDEYFTFGTDRMPDYFVPIPNPKSGEVSGTPAKLVVWIETPEYRPIDLAVFDVAVR